MPAQYFLPGKAIVQLEDGAFRSMRVTPWRVFLRNPAVPRILPVVCHALLTCSKHVVRKSLQFWLKSAGIISFGKETKGKRRLVIYATGR
jgi:DNA-directed RNA polymerase subunit beta'